MKLTCSLAARGRPDLLGPTLDKTLAAIRLPTTRIVVALDRDDIGNVDAMMQRIDDRRLVISIREREDTLWAKYNRATEEATADLYVHMTDYGPLITPGFDEIMLDAASLFPDNIGFVYSGLANMSFPGVIGITRGVASRLGWLFPPFFPYWFGDHWIDDIARLIGRISYAPVEYEVDRRPGTREMREPAFWATFYDCLEPMRRKQALAIIDDPDFIEPGWRKAILRRHTPLIEKRSRYINDIVRGYGNACPNPDERYRRIRGAAISMLREVLVGEASNGPVQAA